MPNWRQLASLINFCTAYYTTQLVRCAAFSFVLIGLVMLLRKILFSERTFLRGMSWTVFLVIPFLGRLKIFYENEAVLKATWRITAVTASWLWVDRVYIAGILITVICIFGKRLRLWRTVSGMEKVMFENVRIYVTDMNITPFTVGLLKPKIVLPNVMADSYSKDELKSVIQHEQTHIRSGHLWFGFAWDILRCLLWINPLLTVFQKHFRADMEDICDRVCIQNSGKTAHEYGMVLLKTLKLLSSESKTAPPAVTYAGERELRKKNSEKLLEKTKEKAAERKEKLEEALEEKKAEKAEDVSACNKAGQLINEKMAASKDGTIYLNDTDMKTIIEAAQEEDAGKTTVKDQPQVGANLDLKI